MEIKINIPANDFVQPTEVREEIVQKFCDHVMFDRLVMIATSYRSDFEHKVYNNKNVA